MVIVDLMPFLIFFFILVFLNAMIFSVIGAGNTNTHDEIGEFVEEAESDPDFDDDIPFEEYL